MPMVKSILLIYFLNLAALSVFAQKPEVKDHIIAGNQNYISGDFSKAEAQYKSALSKDGQSVKANYNLGNSLYQQKRYKEARLHYEKVIQSLSASKSDKFKSFHNIGKTYLDQNNPEKAVESFKQALKLNPYDEETRYNYALAKKLLEKQEEEKQQNQQNNQEKSDKEQNRGEQSNSNQKGKKPDENQGAQQNDGENGNKGEGKNEKQNQNRITKGSDGKNQQPTNSLSKEYQEGILQALENQEQETFKKIISQKAKKVRTNTEKDW